MSSDLDLLAALRRYGFDAATTSPDGRTWQLGPAGSSRYLYVHEHHAIGEGAEYSIHVEEWRGGEGYEAEEFRSTQVAALIDALPRWVAWASEPFEPSRWQRLRTRLGLPSE